jgi:hypothetical protein
MSTKKACPGCGRHVASRQLKPFGEQAEKRCARCRGKTSRPEASGFTASSASGPGDFSDELNRYADCMDEIKRRTEVIRRITNKRFTTGYDVTDVETACLQMRKILELIALASLVANKEEYSKQHEKFANHWRATKILEDIEAVNPEFYPVPTEQIIDPSNKKVVSVKAIESGFLSRDEFVAVYNSCSDMLHAENPYGKRKEIRSLALQVPEWISKVIRLLNYHQIQLSHPDYQVWTVMQNPNDGKVKTYLFRRESKISPP